jgi:DNA-binding response OmpR family regulator
LRILVVEDEYSLADLIATRLKKEKYTVDISNDGEDGLYNALTDIYDLIILDIMLPKINGIDILKEIRKNNIKAKVIMLTAKSELDDKLTGLNTGANDYITKPFHMDELVARINVQLRNNNVDDKKILEYGDIRLNIKSSNIYCLKTNDEINIVNKEFQLLEYFMNNPEQIISKEQIYDKVWGLDNDSISNNLEVFLSFLRKKLKSIGSNVNIKSIRGMGYKMEYNDEEIKK